MSFAIGRVLIAGFGSIGQRHFRNLRQLGCQDFVFLRSRLGTVDDAEIRQYPSTARLEEALDYHPQIAVVATPSALHLDLAVAAADAGCDLYIEKPLTHEGSRVSELVSIVEARRLVAMVGCQFRFHPLLREVQAIVRRGQLGRVIGARAEWGEDLARWHPWEDHRGSYGARRDLGGGVLLTLIHPFDYLHWLFGHWKRIQGMVTRVPALETPAGEDWADVNIGFSNGVQCHVHLDYLQHPRVHSLTVIGEHGRALCDFEADQLQWLPVDAEPAIQCVPRGFERNTMFLDAMNHFLSCVRERTEPCVPIAEGAAAVEMALEARRTAAEMCRG